jgi:hypothetical protein
VIFTLANYGRAFWKRWAGYHARIRIEAKMPSQVALEAVVPDLFDLKPFRERIMAKEPDRHAAEIHIRIALMNRFNAIGTAEIVRIA